MEWCLVPETADMSNYGVVHAYVGCSEAQIEEGVSCTTSTSCTAQLSSAAIRECTGELGVYGCDELENA